MSCNKKLVQNIDKKTSAIVIGAGKSGLAAVRLLHELGAKVKLVEKNINNIPTAFIDIAKKAKIEILTGEHKVEDFVGVNLIVISPGVPVTKILPLIDEKESPEIISETELAYRQLDDSENRIPIIAITGTSGKTTTTSLCSAMLLEQGFKVFTGGNIGTPLSELILSKQEVDVIVLELSSFQLQTSYTLRPRISVLLNISENHLDFHKDMKEYVDAKMRVFRCQDNSDLAILGESLRGLPTLYNLKARTQYFNNNKRFTKMQLFGEHNELNAEAAYLAVKELGVSLEKASLALEKFQPIEHRLELVASKNNILYVNDSKCTTVEALKVALNAFDQPIYLLAGGKFKGGDLEGLQEIVKNKVKIVALYGASKEYFENAWKDVADIVWNPTLKGAVEFLAGVAEDNSVVLLAPACSSFDQYSNYEERGHDFKDIVSKL